MADIAHIFGNDLSVGTSGDISTSDTTQWVKERLLRRLLTNDGGYIWQLDYGAGLPGLVGSPASAQAIAAIIKQQIGLEPAVTQSPEPIVTVQGDQAGDVFATVQYQDTATGTSILLDIPRAI